MKKIIGVGIVLLILIVAVIYRQLTHRCSTRPESTRVCVPASLRDGRLLSYLLFQ